MGPAGRRVVIGVGNPYRGDDAVGPLVLARLDELVGGRDVELVPSDGEPTRLLEAWEGAGVAVVVDAARTGSVPPGTVRRAEVAGPPAAGEAPGTSTHGLGVADAVALAAALGRLPARLVVYTVEGAAFGLGDPISAPVAAAADRLTPAILADLALPAVPLPPQDPAECPPPQEPPGKNPSPQEPRGKNPSRELVTSGTPPDPATLPPGSLHDPPA